MPESKNSTINQDVMLYQLLLVLFAIAIHFLIHKSNKNYARFDVFFLLGFFVVNFQWASMIVFSDIDLDTVSKFFTKGNLLNYSVWLSSVVIIGWLCGFNISCFNRNIVFEKHLEHPSQRLKLKRISNYACYMTSLLFVLFILTVGREFLSGTYRGNANWEGISIYVYTFLESFMALSTALVIYSRRNQSYKSIFSFVVSLPKFYLFLTMSYILFFLLLGDRGPAISVCLIGGILYGTYINAINFKTLATAVICGAIIMLIIGKGRNNDGNIVSEGVNNAEVSSAYDFTMELATSARTILYSIDIVDEDGVTYGKTMLSNLLSVIPMAQSLYLYATEDDKTEIASSTLLTYKIKGGFDHGGVGTSFVADINIAFGLIGIFILPFIHGILIGKVYVGITCDKNTIFLIVYIVLASLSVYLGRDAFFGPIRACAWLLFSFFIVKQLNVLLHKKIIKG